MAHEAGCDQKDHRHGEAGEVLDPMLEMTLSAFLFRFFRLKGFDLSERLHRDFEPCRLCLGVFRARGHENGLLGFANVAVGELGVRLTSLDGALDGDLDGLGRLRLCRPGRGL